MRGALLFAAEGSGDDDGTWEVEVPPLDLNAPVH